MRRSRALNGRNREPWSGFYTPYSTIHSNSAVLLAALGIFVLGFSSIATGVNFITTIHMLRAKGMYWMRLPLFVWSIYATSLVMVLATPVLAMSRKEWRSAYPDGN